MFKRLFLLFSLPLFWSVSAAAIDEDAGTTGFNFLKIGVGARPAALGGAFAAISGDVEAAAWNPAGVFGIRQRSACVSLSDYLVDTQAGFVGIAWPSVGRVYGIGIDYFSYGDMQRTSESGEDLGEFGASDLAVFFTVAQPVWKENLILGVNLKAVYSSIDDYNSDAYMFDIGMHFRGPVDGMTIGASLSNIGFVRSGYAGDFEDSLPVLFRLGVSHRPAHAPLPLLLTADIDLPNDGDPYLSFGAEIRLAGALYLRPGYSTLQTGQYGKDDLGLTAGAGLTMQRYRLDYAFVSYPDLGDVHRLSITGNF